MILSVSCAVLTLLTGFFVLLPLFRASGKGPGFELAAETELDLLMDRKAVIYDNIKDLVLENEMGRLSKEDFLQLEAGYKTEAAVILQKMELLGGGPDMDGSTGKETASNKSSGAGKKSVSVTKGVRCPDCGGDVIPGKKFCPDCGHKL